MPSTWSALKSKFKRRSGRTSPPQPVSHGPEISPQSLQERLWNQAYDELKANESKTVEAYEKILTCELKGGDPASMGFATQENEIEQTRNGRRGQMEQVVRAGLERTAKEAAIKQGIQDGMQAVYAVKGIVDKAVQASPEAAVAWVGVCFALEILSNPITEAGINRQGITYVVSRMDWYWNLAGLLLDENRAETSSAGLRDELEKHVAQLYQKLLLYQMKSVCLYYRNRGAVFLRDMLRLDNWDGNLDEIRKAEDAVRRDSEQYNTEQIRSHLQAIAIAAGSQELKLQDIYLAIQDKKKQQCLKDLRVTDPRDDKARIESTKGGLREDSYRWILDHPDFTGWRDGPQNQLLWIKGDPGKGKTMLLCGIIDQLNRTPTKAGQPAYFFCQGTDARLNNAAAVLRSLIYFLIIQNPPLISYVQDQYDHAGKLLFEDANAWVALSRILTKMLNDTILEDKILIVDALDECVTDLQRLLNFICTSSRAKWVVSSRNMPEIEQQLKPGDLGLELSLESKDNAEKVSHGVNAYIDSKVSEIQSLKDDGQERDRVRDSLREKANGTFLWVALVAQELQTANSWDIPQVVEELPTDLEEVYDRMMHQIQQLQRDDPRFCRLVLSATTLAYRPLHLAELSVLSGLPHRISDKEESMRKIVAICGSFLKVQDDRVYFIHQSAKDYLSGKASSTIFPFGTTIVQRDIFSRSLQGMSKTLQRNIYKMQHPGLPISKIKASDPDPLAAMRYSCAFWVDHLCASKEELMDDGAVFNFLKDHFLHWLESLSLLGQLSDGVLSIRKLLHVAQLQSNKSPRLVGFLKDAEKFVLYHRSIIDRVPVQAYGSALVFSPTMSEVKIGQWKERLSYIKEVAGIKDRWDAHQQTLEGHSDTVNAVSFSPDGRTVASASGDHTVRLWDATTGMHQQTLEGHSDSVYAIAFSPDGQTLASASRDHTVRLWNATTGMHRPTLEGHSDSVYAIAFSPDGKTLASASGDHTVRLWDATTGMHRPTLEGHSDSVYAIAFSPDGKTLASASRDHTVRLWDETTGMHRPTLEGHSDSVYAIAFSPDGQTLASASRDHTVRLWDATTGMHRPTLEGHSDSVRAVAFSPDGRTVASASGDHTVRLWDATTGMHRQTLKGHSGSVRAVAFSPDSKALASASSDKTVQLWDATTETHQRTIEGHSSWVYAVAFSPDGKTLASASGDHTVRLWDATTGNHKQTLEQSGWVRTIAFSLDGKTLASHSINNTVQLWDVTTGEHRQTLEGYSGSVRAVAFSPDSKTIASASDDHAVQLWDATTGTHQRTIEGHSSWVYAVAFSPDGKTLASASGDHTVRLWNAATGTGLQTLEHSGWVYAVAFSPDNKTIASASRDGTVRLWDAATGTHQRTIEGHSSWVYAVAFSPDGKTLASASGDHTVRLWNATTRMHRQTLEGHSGSVRAVAFSPDSKTLASASKDNTVRLWNAATGTHQRTLKGHSSWVYVIAFSPDGKTLLSADDCTVRLWDAATGKYRQTLETNQCLRSRSLRLYSDSSDICFDQKPADHAFVVNGEWVTRDGKNLLWLPTEYRATCAAMYGDTVVLGNVSGGVTFLKFDLSQIDTCAS